MITINDCIFQIGKPDKDNDFSFLGTGFVVPGYILTAGHVVSFRSMIKTEEVIWLQDGRWHSEHSGYIVDYNKVDYAFYICPEVQSLLQLAETDAVEGDVLEINCFLPDNNGVPQRILCNCEVKDDIGLFYKKIVPTKRMTHGASGCPVFKDGKVYGILTGGSKKGEHSREYWLKDYQPEDIDRFSQDDCWMLKASYIKKQIETYCRTIAKD